MMKHVWTPWRSRWEEALAACAHVGSQETRLDVGLPASPSDLAPIEAVLGLTIPESFRDVLLRYASHIDFFWFFAKEVESPFAGIFRGTCEWDLAALPYLEQNRRDWIETCFPDPEEPFGSVWHNKLAFAEVGNGDVLAIDLLAKGNPVVYVSHDNPEIHGWRLGNNFADFIDRWTQLGCVGAEDWQLRHFLPSPTSGLDSTGASAQIWRRWFGISGR